MASTRKSKSRTKLERAMHETHTNEPSTVARANVSESRKAKMRKAIAFSKARSQGAKIPKKRS